MGKPVPELAGHSKTPPHFPWIWDWIMYFPRGVSWAEIESWANVRKIKPSGWECRLLMQLDDLRHG